MEAKSNKSVSTAIQAGPFHLAVVFMVVMIAFSCFRVVAYPPTGHHFGYGDGEFSFRGVMTSLLFLLVTTTFFMCMTMLRFLVVGIGFPFEIELMLQIVLLMWSILHTTCLVAVMPLHLFNYGGLGVSSAVILFYYIKVKEAHQQRLPSAGEV